MVRRRERGIGIRGPRQATRSSHAEGATRTFDKIAAGIESATAVGEGRADPTTYRVHTLSVDMDDVLSKAQSVVDDLQTHLTDLDRHAGTVLREFLKRVRNPTGRMLQVGGTTDGMRIIRDVVEHYGSTSGQDPLQDQADPPLVQAWRAMIDELLADLERTS